MGAMEEVMHNRLLIDEPPLQVLPSLASAIGLNEAIVLQQIHYLLRGFGKERDGRLWVYNTYEQWQEYFPFWSVSTIRRTLNKLEGDGLIEAGNYNQLGFDNTKWYAIDYPRLSDLTDDLFNLSRRPVQSEQMDLSNLNRPIPKTNTKTTDKDDDDRAAPPKSEERDGRWLMESLRETGLFAYWDQDAMRLAAGLEEDYTDDQLIEAKRRLVEQHQKQIGEGKGGISYPLAYMRGILAGGMNEPTGAGRGGQGEVDWDEELRKYEEKRGPVQPIDPDEITF